MEPYEELRYLQE